jgi:hypothetical protein
MLRGVLAFTLVAAGSSGCIEYLEPGDLGTPRYFAEVRGDVPLRMTPPLSDREGNVYVPYGDKSYLYPKIYVGHLGGGWTGKCVEHRGDASGFNGWIGRGSNRAWYWSGHSIVEISGKTGGCEQILARDPSTRATLEHLAVVPMVKESPSRTSTVSLLTSAGDPRAFLVRVDLVRNRYFNATAFEPADATDLVVLGTGADPDRSIGFILLKYQQAGATRVEALYVDPEASVIDRVTIPGADGLGPYSVSGYLASVDGDLVVGLLETGELLAFNRDGGAQVVDAGEIPQPVGVHRWGRRLYLVGLGAGGPEIAPIDRSGRPGAAQPWEASLSAAAALDGADVLVLDDRSQPMQRATWPSPASAIGPYPFLSPHSPEQYAVDTTGWVLAGPSYVAGGEQITAVAFAPIGIRYP